MPLVMHLFTQKNHPLQQLHFKKGGGCIFEITVHICGIYELCFEFQGVKYYNLVTLHLTSFNLTLMSLLNNEILI